MQNRSQIAIAATLALGSILALPVAARAEASEKNASQAAALTVSVVNPEVSRWPVTIPASGRLAAWQEAVIAAEVSGLRVTDVRVDVGTSVKKGELLLQFDPKTAQAELEQQEAAVEKAEAALEQAIADADRARGLTNSGALSKQQTTEYLITERKAKAEVLSTKAAGTCQRL